MIDESIKPCILMKARRIAGCMNNYIWLFTQEAKTRVYKSKMRPVISYPMHKRPNQIQQQLKENDKL